MTLGSPFTCWGPKSTSSRGVPSIGVGDYPFPSIPLRQLFHPRHGSRVHALDPYDAKVDGEGGEVEFIASEA